MTENKKEEKAYEPISKEDNFETKSKGFFLQNKKNIFILLGIIILLCLFVCGLFLLNHSKSFQKVPSCGDGTFYNSCSLVKPYYCNSGKLILNASACGCPKNFTSSENSCTNKFFANPKNVSFVYYLNGKKGEINLTLYSRISKYLDDLPNTITYYGKEVPRLDDLELKRIENPIQTQALMPLLISIQNIAPNSTIDQLKIAISLVQNIPYGRTTLAPVLGGKYQVSLARYPYQVLYYDNASCEGKSELLAFLSKKIGYKTALFYYPKQNHESVGIGCPLEYSLNSSGYCFIETTAPAPISYSNGNYIGAINLPLNNPKIILLGKGMNLPQNLTDYSDSKTLSRILKRNKMTGRSNYFQRKTLKKISKRYNLNYIL